MAPRALVLLAFVLAVILAPASAHADDERDEARALFSHGAALVKEAKWSEALAAFEESYKRVPHPVTLFNVGACERALGSYARARATFQKTRALDASAASGALPESAKGDLAAFLVEIERILVTVDVHLEPSTATIAVDGRPLEMTRSGDVPTLTAGLLEPGPGTPPPVGRFRLEVEPGAHVIVLTRPGFEDVVRREVLTRGASNELDLALSELDGTIEIHGTTGAAVAIDGIDVGALPLRVRRPKGHYHVAVRKLGHVAFTTDAALEPGGRVSLSASLVEEKPSLLSHWWFWAAAGVVVAAATTTTYLLTRPDPERPAANGGSLGWVLRVP